mmetsp:Transcript_45781/g.40996  ORF Transcript_45781/g.40996 Transcript_45781/m.40996 type:complete len:441 (-) Transcript_45781:86-1408(-)
MMFFKCTVIHNMGLVIYRIYHMVTQSSSSKSKKEYTIIEWLSLMSMFIAVLFTSIMFLSSLGIPYCQFLLISGSILYLFTKTSLYFLYLERLFHVFYNSAYAFCKYTVWISRIALITYALMMAFLLIIHGGADVSLHPTHKICIGTPELWVVGIITLVDFVLGIIISILFIRRLLIILAKTVRVKSTKKPSQSVTNRIKSDWNGMNVAPKLQTVSTRSQSQSVINTDKHEIKNHEPEDVMMDIMMEDCNTWKVLQKFTLLTVLAITTTLASLVFAVLFEIAPIWISIDMMINCWCVMLMFHSHHGLYKIMCLRLQKCAISRICLTICACNCGCCKIGGKKRNSNAGTEMVIKTELQQTRTESMIHTATSTKLNNETSDSNIVHHKDSQTVSRKESIVMDVIDEQTEYDQDGMESIDRVNTTTMESNPTLESITITSTQSV